jgi:hypothetical protein
MLIAGCGKPAKAPEAESAAVAQKKPAPSSTPLTEVSRRDTPQLAYTYEVGLLLPAPGISSLMQQQEEICAAAGAALCQVIASEQKTPTGEPARAILKIRAEPLWLKGFRGRLGNDARLAGGRLLQSSATSEDLTRTITDSEAALRAKVLLGQRLEHLLATEGGKLSDLLEVERALAETNSQVDAERSELKIMRERVSTSQLTITYEMHAPFGGVGAWRPLGLAIQDAAGVFAASLGMLVTMIAGFLPIALLGILVAAAWRAIKRREKAADR